VLPRFPRIWPGVDYTADFLYLLDIFVRAHEGYLEQGTAQYVLILTDVKEQCHEIFVTLFFHQRIRQSLSHTGLVSAKLKPSERVKLTNQGHRRDHLIKKTPESIVLDKF
jgi:hypothetical protein